MYTFPVFFVNEILVICYRGFRKRNEAQCIAIPRPCSGGEAKPAGASAVLRSDTRQVPSCTVKRRLSGPHLGAPPPRFPVVAIAIARPNEYAYILAQAINLYFIAMLFHTMLRFRPFSRNMI